MKSKSSSPLLGCGALVLVVIVGTLLVTYWWVTLAVILIAGALFIQFGYLANRNNKVKLSAILWTSLVLVIAATSVIGSSNLKANRAKEAREQSSQSVSESKRSVSESIANDANRVAKDGFKKLKATGKYPLAKSIDVVGDTVDNVKGIYLNCDDSLAKQPAATKEAYRAALMNLAEPMKHADPTIRLEMTNDSIDAVTDFDDDGKLIQYESSSSSQDNSRTVYATEYGERYYYSKNAPEIRDSDNVFEMTENEAQEQGYTLNLRGH